MVIKRLDSREKCIPLTEITSMDSVELLDPIYIEEDDEEEYCITTVLDQGITYHVYINGTERMQSAVFPKDGELFTFLMNLQNKDYTANSCRRRRMTRRGR